MVCGAGRIGPAGEASLGDQEALGEGVFRRRADALVEPHRMSADDLLERSDDLGDFEATGLRGDWNKTWAKGVHPFGRTWLGRECCSQCWPTRR